MHDDGVFDATVAETYDRDHGGTDPALVEREVDVLLELADGGAALEFAVGTGRIAHTSPEHVGIDEFDLVNQTYTSHHVWIDGDGHRQLSVPFRFAWPSELDLMAQLAGLEPEHRWSDWEKSPFTRLSKNHISVWRKPGCVPGDASAVG